MDGLGEVVGQLVNSMGVAGRWSGRDGSVRYYGNWLEENGDTWLCSLPLALMKALMIDLLHLIHLVISMGTPGGKGIMFSQSCENTCNMGLMQYNYIKMHG